MIHLHNIYRKILALYNIPRIFIEKYYIYVRVDWILVFRHTSKCSPDNMIRPEHILRRLNLSKGTEIKTEILKYISTEAY